MKHENLGNCKKCDQIFDRYDGFYKPLRDWFKAFQVKHPEAHISCAGRGELDQEAARVRGFSRARFGQSAHNYNAAIDIFELQGDLENIYERAWFDSTLAPSIPDFLVWYGKPGSRYFELPHVELRDWESLRDKKILPLVGAADQRT